MQEKKEQEKSFFRQLNNIYRVVFVDEESLEEVASYRLTMRKLYILLCSLFVLVAILTVTIITLTPVRYYIPGYAGGQSRSDVVKLKQRVDSLSDLVAAQEEYQQNIIGVITGNLKDPLDTTRLDLKRTKREEINSLLPESKELMKQAARGVKKDNDQSKK